MAVDRVVKESELMALAKAFRKRAGKKKVEAAADMGVSPPTLFLAEEDPTQSLTKLRIRIIEKYSPFRVVGPVYLLKRK